MPWELLERLSIHAIASVRLTNRMLAERLERAREVEAQLRAASISLRTLIEVRRGRTRRQWHVMLERAFVAAGLTPNGASVKATGCLSAVDRWQLVDRSSRILSTAFTAKRLAAWIKTHNKLMRAFGWPERCINSATIETIRTH